MTELPQYVSPKNYLPGEDVSNDFFGSVVTTNYSGETRGTGLSVTCSIENGKVSSLDWNKKDLQLLFDEGIIQPTTAYGYETPPILHFVPTNQQGGGAKAEVIVSLGQIIDVVLTDPGSGYTQAPTVVTAKQFDVIKQRGRKFDSFVTLKIRTLVDEPSPINVFTTIDVERIKYFDFVVGFVASSAVSGDGKVNLRIDKTIDLTPFNISQEIIYDRVRSTQSVNSPTEQPSASLVSILELDRTIDSQPVLNASVEHLRSPLIASVGSITYTFAQYESW